VKNSQLRYDEEEEDEGVVHSPKPKITAKTLEEGAEEKVKIKKRTLTHVSGIVSKKNKLLPFINLISKWHILKENIQKQEEISCRTHDNRYSFPLIRQWRNSRASPRTFCDSNLYYKGKLQGHQDFK
jgi:hypothetical protein